MTTAWRGATEFVQERAQLISEPSALELAKQNVCANSVERTADVTKNNACAFALVCCQNPLQQPDCDQFPATVSLPECPLVLAIRVGLVQQNKEHSAYRSLGNLGKN